MHGVTEGNIERLLQRRCSNSEYSRPVDDFKDIRGYESLELLYGERRIPVEQSLELQHGPEEAVRHLLNPCFCLSSRLHSADQVDIVNPSCPLILKARGFRCSTDDRMISQKSPTNKGRRRKCPVPGTGKTDVRCMNRASHPRCVPSNQPNIRVGRRIICMIPEAAIRASWAFLASV